MTQNFKIKRSLNTRVLLTFLGLLVPLFAFLILGVEVLLFPSVKNRAINELKNTTTLLCNNIRATATVAIRNHLKAIADNNKDIALHHLRLAEQGIFTFNEAVLRVRQVLLSQQVGTSGYVYCLNSKGIAVIHPSRGVEGTDNSHFEFIQKQIELKDGYLEYDWKNPGEEHERPKALYMAYLEPLDWIISASSYRAEFNELININDFRESVLSLRFGERGYAYVFASNGDVLIHPSLQNINVFERSEMPTQFVRQMVTQRKGLIEYYWQNSDERNPEHKIAVFETIDELNWIVVSSAYMYDVLNPVFTARLITYTLIVLLFVISFFTAYLLSRRLTKPVEDMVRTLDYNAKNMLNEPLPIYSQDELGRLAMEINDYLAVVEEQNKNIRKERARYLSLFEASPDAVFLLKDFSIVDCNQSTCTLFEGSHKDLIGKSILDLSPFSQPNDESSHVMAIRLVDSLTSNTVETFEWQHLTLKGKPFHAEVRLKPFDNLNGNKLLVAFVRDISEKKEAEQQLQNQSNFIESILRAIPLPIFFKDKEGRYLGCNREFSHIFGVNSLSIIGKTVHELWPSELSEFYHQKDLELISNPGPQSYEFKVKNKEGQKLDVIFAKDVFYDDKGNPAGIIGAFVDITEQKRTAKQLEEYKNHLELLVKERTEELEAANEELTSINEELYHQHRELEEAIRKLQETQEHLIQSEKMASLGVLAAGVAHEINNPLNFIYGGVLGLEKYFKTNLESHIEKVSPMITGIHEGVRRAASIVSSLNHFSRRYEMPNVECDIHQIIEHCLVMLNNELKYRIDVIRDFTPDSYILVGNEGKLHQVFLNILVNSVQAIENNGTIRITTEVKGNKLVISISDTGQGISPEIISKVMDPFFTTKDPGKGTGLGLSITCSIVKEHKGTIDIDSNPGQGTTVVVTLPLKA